MITILTILGAFHVLSSHLFGLYSFGNTKVLILILCNSVNTRTLA